MKKLLTLMAAMVIAPFSASSQQAETALQPEQMFQENASIKVENVVSQETATNRFEPIAKGKRLSLRTINPLFTVGQDANVIAYEPYTKTIHVPYYAVYDEDRKDGIANGHLRSYVFHGTQLDDKKVISKPIATVQKTKQLLPLNYSMEVLNPKKSTDTLDLTYASCFFPFVYDESRKSYVSVSEMYASVGPVSDPLDFEHASPSKNNAEKAYLWRTPKMAGVIKDGKAYSGFISRLAIKQGMSVQYGLFGYGTVDNEAVDFINTQVMADWETLLAGSDSKTGSWWSKSEIDTDDEGNIYVAGLNHKNGEDPKATLRRVCVRKSTDLGKTWEDFDFCPATVIDEYKKANNNDAAVKKLTYLNAYNPKAFAVTGVDQYSYFAPVLINKTETTSDLHIVEFYKKAGNWGARTVAVANSSISPTNKATFSATQLTIRNVDEANHRDSVVLSSLGMEIEVGRVQDSKDLVVKWIDYRKDLAHVVIKEKIILNEKENFDKDEKVYAVDAFASTRKATETAWSKAINLTNDPKRINNTTHIPRLVPNMNNVPMVSAMKLDTFSYFNSDKLANGHRANYPKILMDMCTKEWKEMMIGMYDFRKVGVKENYNVVSPLTVSNVYPNPVVDNSLNVNLTSTEETVVSLEVIDALGNKVFTGRNQNISGTINVPLELPELASGVYYLNIISNGQSTTKMFTVVR